MMQSDPSNAGPPPPAIHYPESDHMGESGLQKWVCDLLIGLLRSYFRASEERPVLVGGNQFIYLIEGRTDVRIAPDVYVIEDETTRIEEVKCWVPAQHEGRVPSLAVEVVSDEYEKDYDPALIARYEALGVREVVRYDPEFYLHPRAMKFGPRRLLTQWVRDPAGRLVERQPDTKRSLRSLRYDFWFVHEPPRSLRLGIGPQGRRLWPTDGERAEAEAQRAAIEAQRAEAEAQRAERAEAELVRLRAELEALRRGT